MLKQLKGGELSHNLRCAANIEYTDGSCLTIDQLKFLADTYNKAVADKKIKGTPIELINNKNHLIEELDDRLKECNGDHLCWIKHKFAKGIKNLGLEEAFRPEGTKGKIDWLSTEHIDNTMFQMERQFPDFFFYGAVPIDWHPINYNGLAKINFDDIMKNGHKRKNEMMKEYNLSNYYLKNFLIFNAICDFYEKIASKDIVQKNKDFIKKNHNQFDIFLKITSDLTKFKDVLQKFEEQFKSPKYDAEFIKYAKKEFKDFSADILKDVTKINEKVYPIKRIAIVPNMDEHWKGGSHWVAIYADLEKGNAYFFDSYGTHPEVRLRDFFKLFAEWKYHKDTGKKLDISVDKYLTKKNKNQNEIEKKYDIRYNTTRNQYLYSECGVYSMNFIIRLLHGKTLDEIMEKSVPDKLVNQCRELYFNNQKITDIEPFTIEQKKNGAGLEIKKITNFGICQ